MCIYYRLPVDWWRRSSCGSAMRPAALLLLVAATAAEDACAVFDAPTQAAVWSLDGTLVRTADVGEAVCLPDAQYRVTVEADACPQLQCLAPTAAPTAPTSAPVLAPTPRPTPQPSLQPSSKPTGAMPSAVPSPLPTTAKPSSVPTQRPCTSALCWSDQAMGSLDCSELGGTPLLLEAPWSPALNEYEAPRLSAMTFGGAWAAREVLSSALNDNGAVALTVTAAAVFEAGDDRFVLGAVGTQLCRLGDGVVCFAGALVVAPDAAAVYGTSFYYALNLGTSGAQIYRVKALANAEPIFPGEGLAVSSISGAIHGLAAVERDGAAYLVGLSTAFDVLVVRLHPDTHAPVTYAVLSSTVAWGSTTEHAVSFKAAFGFEERAFFAAQEGGMFEVSLSDVPDACWHVDDSATAACATSVNIALIADSEAFEGGLGLSCPGPFEVLDSPAPSSAPTLPDCESSVCWGDSDVDPWDCRDLSGPALVAKTTDGDYEHWNVARYDNDAWSLAETMPVASRYDAAGLLEGANDAFYAVAAVNRSLCRFDSEHLECFAGELQVAPSAGAVHGTTYYYAEGTMLYHVTNIHTDAPIFVETGFTLPFAVGDLVIVDEAAHGETIIGDGRGSASYLIGLSDSMQILAVLLENGAPASYVEMPGTAPGVTTGAFSAGWVFYDEETAATRVVFAHSAGVFEVPAFATTDASVALIRVGLAIPLDMHDGLSCPVVNDLSDAFESAAPTSAPTLLPSYAPTSAPTSKPTAPTVAPTFGCVSRATSSCSGPSQTIISLDCRAGSAFQAYTDGTPAIYAYNLAASEGGYDFVFGPSSSVEALGVLELSDGAWLFGALNDQLCAFANGEQACFSTPLVNAPDAGTVIGTTYYYAASLGDGDRSIYMVEEIHSDAPTFIEDAPARLIVAEQAANGVKLFAGTLGDLASLVEAGTEVIEDGKANRKYLVGLGQRFEVVLIRLASDGYPEAYAVLDSGHTTDPDRYGIDEEEHDFGSAFSFADGVFFGSDDGLGVFQLDLPLTVPASCWNTGTSTSTHIACASTASLKKVRDLTLTGASVDGFNCPSFDAFGRAPSPAPTLSRRRLTSTCAYYVDWAEGLCTVSSGALKASGSLVIAGFSAAECSAAWLSVLKRTIADALAVEDAAVTNVECGTGRRRLAETDSSTVTYEATLDAGSAPTDVAVASALIGGNATALAVALAEALASALTNTLDAALAAAAASLVSEGVDLGAVSYLLNRNVTAACFADCVMGTTSGGGDSKTSSNLIEDAATDLKIVLPVAFGFLALLLVMAYRKRQSAQKDAVEAKYDEGVAERRLRFDDDEDTHIEETKEASEEDVEAPAVPNILSPPLPPRSRDHTTPHSARAVEEVEDDPRSPRPGRSPVRDPRSPRPGRSPVRPPRPERPPAPMTWDAPRPAPPQTPVLYLGDDEDDADDGSHFGDDEVVPPPPPPLPTEMASTLGSRAPEPSVPRPPPTDEYFGENAYASRRPPRSSPGGRLFI